MRVQFGTQRVAIAQVRTQAFEQFDVIDLIQPGQHLHGQVEAGLGQTQFGGMAMAMARADGDHRRHDA